MNTWGVLTYVSCKMDLLIKEYERKPAMNPTIVLLEFVKTARASNDVDTRQQAEKALDDWDDAREKFKDIRNRNFEILRDDFASFHQGSIEVY